MIRHHTWVLLNLVYTGRERRSSVNRRCLETGSNATCEEMRPKNALVVRGHSLDRAGLPLHKRHSHCLRHSIATHLIDAGQSLEYVQDHLGHRSIQSTQVYAKISDAKRERVAVQVELSREVAKIKTKRARGGR